MDLADIVESVGAGVTRFAAGDAVFNFTGGVGGVQGSLAEYAAVDADLLASKPAHLSMRRSAALPLAIITAWQGLVDRARTRSGQTVLVHGGGAAGVGHVGVQVAAVLGAKVFSTVSSSGEEVIRGYGATPIDYTTTTVAQYMDACTDGEGFDVIYDTVGGSTRDDSFATARTYGRHVVSCLGWGIHKLAPWSFRAATYSGVFTLLPLLTGQGRAHHDDILREATVLIEAGKLVPLMETITFDFVHAFEAHELVGQRRANGRVVVSIG